MGDIKTKHNWHPNTSIEFTDSEVVIRVSLNIPPAVAAHLSPNNVQRGRKYTVYSLKWRIPNEMVCRKVMEEVHKILIENCQRNIANAKAKLLPVDCSAKICEK